MMNEEFWMAIVQCDQQFDGIFFYGVKTTRIFCRPSCCSRTPKKQNVVIFSDNQMPAEQGFRPCKRCRPDQLMPPSPKEKLIQQAVHYLSKHYSREIGLKELAEVLYISPYYLQRTFKSIMGLSPSDYVKVKRIEEAKLRLKTGNESLTNIAFEIGFKNSAYFSSVFKQIEGVTPSEYRQTIQHCVLPD
ncbi:bifunctional transcriptional activator/DNA repair enzyme AdaA [Heyndrickxia acidicola]|uniref:Ada metal-binding domain-containing protein n=1 Tax=Heyndrickxia acidicola TaxID=209389 RepID=A0ABU6MGI9_9BACI|nr:Ada metal-binding domain-containing protein [Heyndrickxia acidicola]MED1203800.1 Ada metal-binding domain-containing protein [Heyndrickxia acidicola]